MFLTIYMWQFGWLSERGRNFLNLLQKEGGTQKGRGWGVTSEKKGRGGVPTLGEIMVCICVCIHVCMYIYYTCMYVCVCVFHIFIQFFRWNYQKRNHWHHSEAFESCETNTHSKSVIFDVLRISIISNQDISRQFILVVLWGFASGNACSSICSFIGLWKMRFYRTL